MVYKTGLVLMILLLAGDLFAGEGKLRIASEPSGAYVYVDGKKRAMTGDGFTSILVEEGDHVIKLVKPVDDEHKYEAKKTVFVGAETSMVLEFDLKKVLTAKGRIKKVKDFISSKVNHTEYTSIGNKKCPSIIYRFGTMSTSSGRSYPYYNTYEIQYNSKENSYYCKYINNRTAIESLMEIPFEQLDPTKVKASGSRVTLYCKRDKPCIKVERTYGKMDKGSPNDMHEAKSEVEKTNRLVVRVEKEQYAQQVKRAFIYLINGGKGEWF